MLMTPGTVRRLSDTIQSMQTAPPVGRLFYSLSNQRFSQPFASRAGLLTSNATGFFGYPDLSVFPTHEQARRHLGVKPDFVVAFRVVSMYH